MSAIDTEELRDEVREVLVDRGRGRDGWINVGDKAALEAVVNDIARGVAGLGDEPSADRRRVYLVYRANRTVKKVMSTYALAAEEVERATEKGDTGYYIVEAIVDPTESDGMWLRQVQR